MDGTRNRSRVRQHAGIAGGYLGLAMGLAGLWILLGDSDDGTGYGLVVAGIAVIVLAAVALDNAAFGALILVGPPASAVLLLVRYATADADDRRLGWAVVGGAMLAVTVLLLGVARRGVRKAGRSAALKHDGIPALAEVLSITRTGHLVGPTPEMLLEVELTLEHGRPYRGQRRIYVAASKMPRPGDVLSAKIDPDDPERWSVDLEPDRWRRVATGAGT